MYNFITALILIFTTVLVFGTSAFGVYFIHSYHKAIARVTIQDEIKDATMENIDYHLYLQKAQRQPINKNDFTKIDEHIFQLARKNHLTAYNISEEEHILEKTNNSYRCQLNLVGSEKDIQDFITALTKQAYLINITKIQVEALDDEYIAKIDYLIYFAPENISSKEFFQLQE